MALCAFLLSGDEQAIHAVRQILEELHGACEHTGEPPVALQKIESQHFDIILADCDDQQLATSVFQAARRSEANKRSVTIALADGKTGLPSAFRAGAELVLTKPVSLEQARTTLKSAIGMSRKSAQVASPLRVRAAAAGTAQTASEFAPDGAIIHQKLTSQTAGQKSPMPAPPSVSALAATPGAGASVAASPLHSAPPPSDEHKVLGGNPKKASRTLGVQATGAPPTPEATDSKVDDEPILAELDEPILAELAESENKKVATTVAPTRAKQRRSLAPLLALAAVVVVVVSGYAAWATQPALRVLLKNEYGRLKPHVAGIWSNVQSLASSLPAKLRSHHATSSVTTPSQAAPAQNVRSVNSIPSSEAGTASSPTSMPSPSAASDSTSALNHEHDNASNTPVPVPVASTDPKSGSTETNEPVVLAEAVADNDVVHRVQPVYPKLALQKKVQGVVQLQATVNKLGKVDSLRVVNGDPLLVPAAIDAVKQWQYTPYQHNGQPTPFETQVTLEFRTPGPR